MPLCSAFTPFGQLRFSSVKSKLHSIYESAMAGVDGVYAADGAFAADVYATAREVAAVDATLERVKNHQNPLKACELLADLENEYGLVPHPTDTLAQRREALADRVYLRHGARYDAIESGCVSILGAGFVAYYTYPNDVGSSPTDDPYEIPGSVLLVPPKTPIRLYRITDRIDFTGSQWVDTTFVAGDTTELCVGERILIEPGRLGCEEAVTITAVGTNSFSASFVRAHEPNSLARTGCWPRWTSSKRFNVVVVSTEAYADARKMAKLHDFLERSLRAVSRWHVCTESSPGVFGPFNPNTGIPNVTPITEVTF